MVRVLFLMVIVVASLLSVATALHPENHDADQLPWQKATEWPDRIIATVDGEASTTIAVSWRTSASVTETRAEIALASPSARFDLNAQSVQAETELLDLTEALFDAKALPIPHNDGLPATSHHSVRFNELEPDTLYAYRVQGAEGHWSEWFHTRTAPKTGPVQFVYLGDAQNGLASHWPRVIRGAFQKAPEARFILHAGDLVNRGSRDLEWAHWFRAGGFIHGMIPAVAVAGNHEYDRYELSEGEQQRLLSILWRPQFRFPVEAELSPDLHETVYDIRYTDDLHVFVLNTNISDMAEQAAWLDRHLGESDAAWRVVSMHHPIFSSGRGRDNQERRAAILPILLKYQVDLVLQGHDHTYARGTLNAQNQQPMRQASVDEGRVTSMFINSVSGSKQYEFNEDGWDQYAPTGVVLDRKGENTQFFQVIDIEADHLEYRAYSADGELYDGFRLVKSPDGTKTISELSTDLPPERRFENTLPYEGVKE